MGLPGGSTERKHDKSKATKDAFLKTADVRDRQISSLIWHQTPAADGLEEREEVRHLTNILFCTEQIASTGVLSVMITRLCHTLAVEMDVYVSAKMPGIF